MSRILDAFGLDLVGGDRAKMRKLVASSYQKLESQTQRDALRIWIKDDGAKVGIDRDAFFCDVFAGADALERVQLMSLLGTEHDASSCVDATLMAACANPGLFGFARLWLPEAFNHLLARRADDPRIVPWAKDLIPKIDDEYRIVQLDRIAGIAPKPTAKRRNRRVHERL